MNITRRISAFYLLQVQQTEDSRNALDNLAKSLLIEKLLPQCLTSSEVSSEAARKLLIATTIFPSAAGIIPAVLLTLKNQSYHSSQSCKCRIRLSRSSGCVSKGKVLAVTIRLGCSFPQKCLFKLQVSSQDTF